MLIAVVLCTWLVVSLPVALFVGRLIRAAELDLTQVPTVRDDLDRGPVVRNPVDVAISSL